MRSEMVRVSSRALIVPLAATLLCFASACSAGARRPPMAVAGRAVAANSSGKTLTTPASQASKLKIATKAQLIIRGSITLQVDNVRDAVAAVRKAVAQRGGRVVHEQITGGRRTWSAQLKLRLRPNTVDAIVGWLGSRGKIVSKRLTAEDVSRQLFDQKIALENNLKTLERLRALLKRPGLKMKEILAIERQMTRLRGVIEQIKGAQRYLKDRVAWATVTLYIRSKPGAVVFGPRAKVYPGAGFSTLILVDREGRQRVRAGGRAIMHLMTPRKGRLSLELDVFEDVDDNGAGAIVTLGGAMYSDFLGRGRRRWLNPYLGFRLGYSYVGRSSFVVSGGAGIELFKHRYVMVDVNFRMMALLQSNVDIASVASAGVVFAF